jgi:hypothetical protein
MNISINFPLSKPELNPYSGSGSAPMDVGLNPLADAMGGKGGGQQPISFGGPESTSGTGQNPMRLSPEDLSAGKTAGSAQGGDNDISKILEKIVQLLQELFQSLMQKPDQGEEGEGGPAPVGKSSGGAPAQAQAPSGGAGGGGGGGAPAAGGPTGAPPLAQNAAVTDGAAPAGGVTGTEGASGLHLPPALADHEKAIGAAAKASGQPANVIAGMMWAESRGNSSASTVNGGNGQSDSGLMQVNSATAAEVQSKYSEHFKEGMTPDEKNIMTGALYLKDMEGKFGKDMDAKLRGYNSGPDTVNIKDPSDISKTGLGDPNYVTNVNNFAEIIGTGKGQLPA